MQCMRSVLVILALCSTTFATESNANREPVLKLKTALETSLAANPVIQTIRERETQAKAEIPAARSVIFPTLTATVSGTRTKDAVNIGTPRFGGDPFNIYGSGLKLNQTLFQVGSLSAITVAKQEAEISKLNTEISARDLTSTVIQGYFLVVLYSRNVETLVAQQKIAQEAVVTARRREHIGRGSALEILQSKTQLALLDGHLETARNLLQEATASLAHLMGDTTSANYTIEDKMEAPEISALNLIIDLKNYKIPEITLSELNIEKIDSQKQILWGQNLPSLSLVGNYAFSNYVQSDLYNENAAAWSVGLQLTIPLFSGFSTIYKQRSLDSQKAQYFLNKQATINQLSYQQITSRKKLETAHASIKTGQEALKLATASVTEARRNFNLANIDFLQFLSVQQAHVEAQQALNQYKYNYIVALTNYFAASGQDMQKLVELIEQANL